MTDPINRDYSQLLLQEAPDALKPRDSCSQTWSFRPGTGNGKKSCGAALSKKEPRRSKQPAAGKMVR
jgi:hypothetical protein